MVDLLRREESKQNLKETFKTKKEFFNLVLKEKSLKTHWYDAIKFILDTSDILSIYDSLKKESKPVEKNKLDIKNVIEGVKFNFAQLTNID